MLQGCLEFNPEEDRSLSKSFMSSKIKLSAAGLFLVPLFTVPAHAYIDPGTASIVLQGIIGGIAAAGLFFRTHIMGFYYKIFPGSSKAKNSKPSEDQSDDAA